MDGENGGPVIRWGTALYSHGAACRPVRKLYHDLSIKEVKHNKLQILSFGRLYPLLYCNSFDTMMKYTVQFRNSVHFEGIQAKMAISHPVLSTSRLFVTLLIIYFPNPPITANLFKYYQHSLLGKTLFM